MNLSSEYRKIMIEEIKLVRNKMANEQNYNKKNFYYSAIYGHMRRIFNFDYDPTMIFMHQVFHQSYRLIEERLAVLGTGNQIIIINDDFWKELDTLLNELEKTLKKEDDIVYPILEKIACLAYLTTGNGAYLKEKEIK